MAIIRITTPSIADDAVTTDKYIEYPPYRNLIINGDMSVAQRGTSFTGLTGTSYTLDRWRWTGYTDGSVGTFTVTQDTTVPTGQGFAKSLKADCTTAQASPTGSNSLVLKTRFEGQNLQYLKKGTSSAESLTLSFWVRSNKTGTYVAELEDNDNTRHIAKTYTISAADTWEKKTITFDGDTTGAFTNDNNLSLTLGFYLVVGPDLASGTQATSWASLVAANRAADQTVNIADSTSNEWYITGVQLEVGTTASDFEFLPYDVNLQRCYRYYEKDTTEYRFSLQTNADFGAKTGHLQWKATKRATPSLTADPDAGNVNLTRRTIWGCGLTLGGAVSSSSNLPNGYIADSEL